MEKTPSPFSPLPSRQVSLCPSHEWVLRSPPLSIHSVSPSPHFVDPSRCLYLAFSFSVGWILSRLVFLHSPYPEPKVPEPAQTRKAFGGPAAPASWVPSVLRFVSFLLSFPFCSSPCTALRESTRRRKWRVSRTSFVVGRGPRYSVLISVEPRNSTNEQEPSDPWNPANRGGGKWVYRNGTCSRSSDIIGRVNPECGPRSVFRHRCSFFSSFAPFLFLPRAPRRGTQWSASWRSNTHITTTRLRRGWINGSPATSRRKSK